MPTTASFATYKRWLLGARGHSLRMSDTALRTQARTQGPQNASAGFAQSPLFVASFGVDRRILRRALARTRPSSRNTLDAYRRDLRLFSEWLAQTRSASLDTRQRGRSERVQRGASEGQIDVGEPAPLGVSPLLRGGLCASIARRR